MVKSCNQTCPKKFSRILTTISCLITTVEINHDDEVGHMIDMVNGINVKTKYLLMIVFNTPFLNVTNSE